MRNPSLSEPPSAGRRGLNSPETFMSHGITSAIGIDAVPEKRPIA